MKIIINKNLLDSTLEIVSKFTDPVSSFYGMRCIKLSATKEKLVFQACNEVTSIIKTVFVDDKNIVVEEDGEIVVQGNYFKNIVKKLSGFIELSTSYNKLEIKQQDSHYTLSLNELNSFATIEQNINLKKFEINTEEFKKAIRNVSFAASTGPNLIFKCINFRSAGRALNLTATDSHRLAYYSIKTNQMLEDFEFSVNAKDVRDMIPSDAPEKITLFFNSLKFGIEYENTIITARITDLPYHDIEQLFSEILSNIKYKITINKSELNNLLNKIWINTALEKQNRVHVKINKNEFNIHCQLDELGDSMVKTSNFELAGNPLIFDINFIYFKDSINITDGEIYILIDEKIQKIIIFSKNNPNSKQIITPLRR
ncbi:DNA polymerase III subunit beta [Mycoplasma tauri]|uniref:DNA polymerase III subunit beta n=1 Tax=Mycoplasma tauri TaxID=547987 RepID=UPI00196859E7|nr:DNA polymerase III subunit beta [Mycoplasma tauri]MBZ4203459.1 DNA polymerase III subunit beta [Mycoplasma tauri]QSB07511.1 DNA polymerase III subunit beta [Mycoplasma tauri]